MTAIDTKSKVAQELTASKITRVEPSTVPLAAQSPIEQKTDAVGKTALADAPKPKVGVITQVKGIVSTYSKTIGRKFECEAHQIKEKQGWVSDLHKLRREINNSKNTDGSVTLDLPSISKLLENIRDPMVKRDRINRENALKANPALAATAPTPMNPLDDPEPAYSGLDIDTTKSHYTKEEVAELLESITLAEKDLDVDSNMQLQKISNLMNERIEAFKLAKDAANTYHQAMMAAIRGIRAPS